MESDQSQGLSLSDHSKKIKKKKEKCKVYNGSPKNESDEVSHFTPSSTNDLIFGKYLLVKHIADGTFGRVFDAIDKITFKHCAIKIVKATKNCADNAKTEASKLKEINAKIGPQGRSVIVQLLDEFYWKKHYCLVFEKLSLNLYDYLKIIDNQGYPDQMFKEVFRQLLLAVNYIHSLELLHTDIKPENALFLKNPCEKSNDYSIKLIDFGNISTVSEGSRIIVTTRQYRAPEVILGCCKWGKPCDVWSVGCVALEVYLGKLFFDTHCNYEHLALIEKKLGNFPTWMIKSSRQKLKSLFVHKETKQGSLAWQINKNELNKKNLCNLKEALPLKEIFKERNDENLYDLLKRVLNIDPIKRITCEEALKHKYFA